ncbi:MAG TPA: hypothetical protein VMV10_26800 [Pirellulales bacterium]|nr:hypothetical protein [Pirellulales bacterium]
MNKPPFQFSLKSIFAATAGAAILMAISAAVPAGTATAFGTLLAAWVLCGVVTLIFGFVASTILYLACLMTVFLFEPAARRPTLVQVKRAAWMLTISAVVLAGAFACLCLFILFID